MEAAKSEIAGLLLRTGEHESRMGRLSLRAHQHEVIPRIIDALNEFGGALVCDEVGLGKTFTAAAVMRAYAERIVLAPAALLSMWRSALDRAEVSARVVSIERFSRIRADPTGADLVVIDEAHHLRNASTARFRNVASFVRSSRVLMLSATPVHNRARDLTTLVMLFMGSGSKTLTAAQMSRCVIRRTRSGVASVGCPRRQNLPAVSPPASPLLLNKLLGLPAPIPPRDGHDCALLIRFTLLRQWASSDASLRAALESRIGRARALVSALEAGTYPTRAQLSAWVVGGMDVQLGFPELLAEPGGSANLLGDVVRHEVAVKELLTAMDAEESADLWRAEYLRSLRKFYPDRKIVAFSGFAATVRGLYRLMRNDKNVAVVTSARCEFASGRVSRDDVIRRFAPVASGCAPPPTREAITLLLASDICSEGLNLQDAGVVVHLDTPWTPAKIEQRVGRIARPGSTHPEVFIHTIRNSDIAEQLLRIDERLRQKSGLTTFLVGSGDSRATDAGSFVTELSIPDATEAIRGELKFWSTARSADGSRYPAAGFTASRTDGFIAVVGDRNQNRLIGGDARGVTNDPRRLLRIIRSLGAREVAAIPRRATDIAARIHDWLRQERLVQCLGIAGTDNFARKLVKGMERTTRETPVNRRVERSAVVDTLRRELNRRFTAAEEIELAELSPTDYESWMQARERSKSGRKTKAEPIAGSGLELKVLLIGRTKDFVPKLRSDARSS